MKIFKISFLGILFLGIIIADNNKGFKLKNKNNSEVVILFTNEDVDYINKDGYTHLSGPDTKTIDNGLPELPKYSFSYGINPNKDYEVSFVVKESHVLTNMTLYPYQEHVDKKDNNQTPSTFFEDIDYFDSHQRYPSSNLYSSVSTMRGYEILMIDFIPYYYNYISKDLMVFDEVEITLSEKNSTTQVNEGLKGSKVFERMYQNMILDSFDDREIDYQQPSILYICGGSSLEYTYLEYLIDWKRKQGYKVSAVDLSDIGGNSTTYIKNYIEDAYYNWDDPPEFVCLIGDASGSGSVPTVPAYNVGSGNGWSGAYAESDLPYVLLDGDDLLADATIGRISVRSENEFSIVASKIIGYEKLYAGDDWIESVALVGDPYDSGISTVITNEYIAQIMENYGVEDINEQYSGSSTFDDFMRNQINEGISYLNYRGFYGFSGFTDNDVNQLNNGFKLPFLTTLTCDTGSYESDVSCIAESLLRAGTSVNNPKGAVAVVATAQPYTHTAFNNIVAMGMYSGIFLYGAQTAGEALIYGELALGQAYPQNPNNNVYYFSAWNNLMGDPSTVLWTDTPRVLISDHASLISGSDDFIEVVVIDENEQPVEGANVNLTARNNYVNADTDVFGRAFVPLHIFSDDSENDEVVTVTVTCHDCLFSESTFTIDNSLYFPELISSSIIIDDSDSDNSDGYANPGESIGLLFDLVNNSTDSISDLYLLIQSSDESLSSDTYYISEIMPNSNYSIELNLVLPLDIFPDNEPIFSIYIYGDQDFGESNQLFPLEIYSGSVNLNFSSEINPGESSSISIELQNIGEINLDEINGIINYNGGDLSFSDINISWASTLIGESSYSGAITMTAQNDIINGSVYNIPVEIYNNSFHQNATVSVVVGDVSVTDPLGPDSYGYYIYDELDSDYDMAPSYSWIEINPSDGGNGYELNLSDNGNNQDDVTTISLPFNFTFYGETYSEVSVCSNGWISFGETDLESFRNYPIPGTGGPSPMVAVFWDDLEDGGIFAFNDSENDRFIIQWDVDTYYANSNEIFQIILYNTGSQTPTGDDEMLLQYRDFNNTSIGSYPVGNYSGPVIHGQYTSVGIEDHTGLVGLEYTFNNEYPTAAMPLSDQSALFITTRSSAQYAQPSIDISVEAIEVVIDHDEISSETISISNDGEPNSYLNYNMQISSVSNPQTEVDSYGYTWSSSQVDEYISYEWLEIEDSNITLEFESNDQSPGYFDIGFPFPFYGESYSQILINPNGWVGFGEDSNEWDNQNIYDEDSPKNAIFGYWDDLNPMSGDNSEGEGYVRYHSNSSRLVIWYDDVIHWTSNEIRVDFQIILYPSGEIKFNYRDIQGFSNDGATIGIVDASGTVGHQVSYDDGFTVNQSAILFNTSPNWLSLNSAEGILGYNEVDDIILTFDMSENGYGYFSCYLVVESNASTSIIVPVTALVEDSSWIMGDLNGDGQIDVLDIVRLVSLILNYDGSYYENYVADINQDDDVNVMDVVLLVQIILND